VEGEDETFEEEALVSSKDKGFLEEKEEKISSNSKKTGFRSFLTSRSWIQIQGL